MKLSGHLFVAICCGVASLASTQAADRDDLITVKSPDGKLVAIARKVPDPTAIQRRDLDGCRVMIFHEGDEVNGEPVAAHTFPKRAICQMKWTPDSRFLVFTTTSSGGHSPWHFPAYAFCSDEKEFCDLEPALKEPVTSAEFSVIATDQLSISVRDETADNKDEMGSRKVTISLSNIAAQMRKLTSDNEL